MKAMSGPLTAPAGGADHADRCGGNGAGSSRKGPRMGRGVINRLFVAVCAVAFAAATFACADGSSVGDNEGGEAPVACPLPPLALVEWAQRACAVSEEAIDTLDVPG